MSVIVAEKVELADALDIISKHACVVRYRHMYIGQSTCETRCHGRLVVAKVKYFALNYWTPKIIQNLSM